MYDDVTKEEREKAIEYKKQLTQIEKKIRKIEERHILEEISREFYDKYAPEYNAEKANVLEKLSEAEADISNPQKCAEEYLQLAVKLPEIWAKADFFD